MCSVCVRLTGAGRECDMCGVCVRHLPIHDMKNDARNWV